MCYPTFKMGNVKCRTIYIYIFKLISVYFRAFFGSISVCMFRRYALIVMQNVQMRQPCTSFS